MKTIFTQEFRDDLGINCHGCMLSVTKGDKVFCAALGSRPEAKEYPEDGCRHDCPLKPVNENK